jgi:hypothetical protein
MTISLDLNNLTSSFISELQNNQSGHPQNNEEM